MSSRKIITILFAAALIAAMMPVLAGDDPPCHEVKQPEKGKPRYTKSLETYDLPELNLIDQDGDRVDVAALGEGSDPVVVTFVFTTCTTICPVMTATFSKVDRVLAAEGAGFKLVSVSIDPEFDNPRVLKKYAERWKASDDWSFLTGDLDDVNNLLRSFQAYYGDKMNHKPLYLMKAPGQNQWVRIEGLARGSDLGAEYRQLVAER